MDEGVDPTANDDDFTEQVCSEIDLQSTLIEALDRLDPLYSIVLYYYYGEDMTAKSIAELLGIKYDTARARLMRGRKLLLKELSSKGGDSLAC